MILVNKVDFQGDDLYVYYNQKGDSGKFIRNRVMIINWKSNEELVSFLKKIFQSIIDKYLVDLDGVKIDWSAFMADVKKYEEKK